MILSFVPGQAAPDFHIYVQAGLLDCFDPEDKEATFFMK